MISFASLANVNKITPVNLPTIPHFDKIVHFLMYSTLTFTFLWENFTRHHYHVITNRVFSIIIIVIAVGIIMELLQKYLTNYRSGDIKDEIANTTGLICGWIGFNLSRNMKFFKKVIFKPL